MMWQSVVVLIMIVECQNATPTPDSTNISTSSPPNLPFVHSDHASHTNGIAPPPEKPKILSPKQYTKPIALSVGSRLEINCRAKGNPKPTIAWIKDGGSSENPVFTTFPKFLNSSEDSGNYTCIACNSVGCDNRTVQVIVYDEYPFTPFFENELKNITAAANTDVTMECIPLADFLPRMEWCRTEKYPVIADGDIDEVGEDECVQVLGNRANPEVFTIHNVRHEHEGWYTCFARNRLGTAYSTGYLQVIGEVPEELSAITLTEAAIYIIIIVLCSSLIIVLATVLGYCHWRKRKEIEDRKRKLERLSPHEIHGKLSI